VSITAPVPDLADEPVGAPLRPLPAALPVVLDVRGPWTANVRGVVEGELGWQPVDEVTATLVPPAVRLADVSAGPGDGTPTVLVVTAEDAPAAAAEATIRVRPSAILDWPATGDDLIAAVTRATAAPRGSAVVTPTLRIGGAAGGVGTTTVALAVAGTAAWRGRSVLVASGEAVLLPPGTPSIDPAALAAPDLWSRAAAIEGVPGARAVRTVAPAHEGSVVDPSVEVAVLDLGVASDVDVLVVRPDALGLAALTRTTAAVVAVVGRGPATDRALSDAIGGRRRLDLPWSARVGRAALVGRVPASLPGSFVRALLPLVPSGPSG
jgi:hypothetical protein